MMHDGNDGKLSAKLEPTLEKLKSMLTFKILTFIINVFTFYIYLGWTV